MLNFYVAGEFNDVSEDTHWTQFLNASILYINSRYPKPWNTVNASSMGRQTGLS